MKTRKFDLPTIREIEIPTAELWLSTGAIRITDKGDENTYYENEFGHKFFCKNRMPENLADQIAERNRRAMFGAHDEAFPSPDEWSRIVD